MDTMEKLDELMASGTVNSFFAGKSAVPGVSRFSTLKNTRGDTIASGQGNTCLEAIESAINKLAKPVRRKMPGIP